MDTKNTTYNDADNPFAGIGNQPALLSLDGTGHALGFYATHSSTAPSKLIDLAELGEMVRTPLSKAKNELPLILPHSAAGKTAQAAQDATYSIAVIDYDGVEQSAPEVLASLRGHGYSGSLLYYTTSSHGSTQDRQGRPKPPHHYKVIVPLDTPTDAQTYHRVATGLNLLAGADIAQARPYQGFYAPNSNTAGQPYEGEALDLGKGFLSPDCGLYKAAIARYEQHSAAQVATAAAATPKPKLGLSSQQGGIIELINQAYTIPALLEANGHKRRGKGWLSPNSTSGIAGGVILSNGRFYSHHANCELGAVNNDGHSLDAADIHCLLHYEGDVAAMITAEAVNLDPEGNKERQRQEMAARERQRDAQPAANAEVVRQDLRTPTDAPRGKKNLERIYNIIKDTAIGRRAKDLAQMVEMPTDTVCLAGLGVVSAMVAGARTIKRRDGYSTVPVGLYIAVEQPPSTGKSSIINGFRNPILKHLIEANKRHVAQVKEAAKEAGEEEPKFVQCLNLFQSNATPEAMEEIVANNDGLFSIVGDEQAAIDTLLGLTYGDGNNNNGLILNGFAGEYFNSARVTRKGFTGTPYGGVTVMAQEGTARKIVQGSQGQGVVERFLLWNEPNLLGTRSRAFHEATTEEEYSQIASNLVKLTMEQYKKESGGLDNLASLGLTEGGYKAIHGLMCEIEPLLADDGKYSHPILRGAAGKADMQIMKIAATLHMADECLAIATPDTTYWQPHYLIKDKYVAMAIEVVKVTLDQLIHTLETNGIIGRDSYMDALAEYLEGKHKPLTARAIAQSQKNRSIFKSTGKPTQYINEALQRLVDIEVVTATQETIGGKPQTVYKMY